MHATDVLGYTADADVYCPDCARDKYGDDDNGANPVQDGEGNEVRPIFSGSETDCPSHCAECGAFIAEDLTSDGVAYVLEALKRYIAAAVFVNADGRKPHGGSASALDTWHAEYTYLEDDKTTELYAKLRERERAALSIVLVTLEGRGWHRYGTDASGATWTETDAREDGTAEDCQECGADVYAGWMCLDGGHVVCSSHIFTPDDAKRVAADWQDGSTLYGQALAAVASTGTVKAEASTAARAELTALDMSAKLKHTIRDRGALAGYPATRNPFPLAERAKLRNELRALAEYCDDVRSAVYPAALLDIRELVSAARTQTGGVWSTLAERIAERLRECGLSVT